MGGRGATTGAGDRAPSRHRGRPGAGYWPDGAHRLGHHLHRQIEYSPAAHAIRRLRDLLSRCCGDQAGDSDARALPLVYEDTVPLDLVDALESAVVASSESRQHQSFAEVLRVFSTREDRLPPAQRMAMAAMIKRSIARRTRALLCALRATEVRHGIRCAGVAHIPPGRYGAESIRTSGVLSSTVV